MFDPQFKEGRDGLTPRERAWLDAMTDDQLRAKVSERPRDWSRSASIPNGVELRKEKAYREYARSLLAQRVEASA